MSVREQVFLNQHCECGGKIVRYLLGSKAPDGDSGDQVFQTKIIDCCTGECEPLEESPVINWPLCGLDDIFQKWTTGPLSRAEFDEEIDAFMKKVCVSWRLAKTG